MEKYYYFIDQNDNQLGPFAIDGLRHFNITPQTPVWCEGMTDWQPAGQVAELSVLFESNGFGANQQMNSGYQQQYNAYGQGGGQYGGNPYQQYRQPTEPKPDNWLVWAILCTVFCCLPFGIAGIVYAAQVDSLWNQGRFEESKNSAKKARLFTLIGIGICVAGVVLYLLFVLIAAMIGAAGAGAFYYGY